MPSRADWILLIQVSFDQVFAANNRLMTPLAIIRHDPLRQALLGFPSLRDRALLPAAFLFLTRLSVAVFDVNFGACARRS